LRDRRARDALLCPDYLRIKDALAAAAAGDTAWLHQTGCFIDEGGKKVALVDAPNSRDGQSIWRGRVYPKLQSDGIDAYFRAIDALTFAGFFDDKNKAAQIDFVTQKEAEQWLNKWLARQGEYTQRTIPHGTRILSNGRVRPVLGPTSLDVINYTACPGRSRSEGVTCWMMYPPP